MDNNPVQPPIQPFMNQPTQPIMQQPITPITPTPQPKSKHTGKIITIILSILVLLAGAGLAIYYFLILPQDPKYIADKVVSRLSSNLSLDSTVAISGSFSASSTLPTVASLGLDKLELGLDSIITPEQKFYLKPSGLTPIISLFAKILDPNISSMPWEDLAEFNNFIENLNSLEDHWIGLDLNEINQSFTNTLDTACLKNYASTLSSYLYTAYQKAPFLEFTPAEDNFYALTIDADHVSDFIVDFSNFANQQNLNQCVSTPNDKLSTGNFSLALGDINIDKEALANLPTLYLAFDSQYNITDFKTEATNDYITASIKLHFAYGDEADALIPTDAYDINKLQSIFELIFLPVSNLQTSQRDTQRRSDLMRLETQITNYQASNRGQLPRGDWSDFYSRYLTSHGDAFTDPDGTDYILSVSSAPVVVPETLNHIIYITTKAACDSNSDGETKSSTNSRAYAIQYRLESGALYCMSN